MATATGTSRIDSIEVRAAAASSPASSCGLPTICRPTGRPSSVKPAGMLIAGQALRVIDEVVIEAAM
jgi:hypothetical protein